MTVQGDPPTQPAVHQKQDTNGQVKRPSSSAPKVPPDGKWGWIIVFAYGLANVRELILIR